MKTRSKVKSVQQDGTWNSKHGDLMYRHEYQFEDGIVMQASHKTQSPFPAGSEVEYEVKRDDPQYGKSGTVGKPQEQWKPKKQQGSNASFALSYAKDWCLGVHNAGTPQDTTHVIATAGVFLTWLNDNS